MKRARTTKVSFAAACAALAMLAAPSTPARVIGEDGRRAASQEERQRYSAIGIVVVSDGRRVYAGTGTLIDELTVLTAFHNVFHDGRTGPIGQVQAPLRMMQFLVGDRLTRYAIKSIRPFSRNYEGLVLPDENDLAVVTLQSPVVGVQPLTLRALEADNDGTELGAVTLVAYDGLKKKLQECRFHERVGSYPSSPEVLVHDCDSEGNASGAPFLDASGALVAIHLGGNPRGTKAPGRPFNAKSNFNIARRVTPVVLQFVDGESQAAKSVGRAR